MTGRTMKPMRTFGKRTEPHRITISRGNRTRSFTLRPVMAFAAITTLALLGTGLLGATAYLVFRDQIVSAQAARHAFLQRRYEDRIAALRTELERMSSRQLMERKAVESKIDILLERKSRLENRDEEISQLFRKARSLGIAPPVLGPKPVPKPDMGAGGTGSAAADAAPAYLPAEMFESFGLRLSDAGFLAGPAGAATATGTTATADPPVPAGVIFSRIETDFDDLEKRQTVELGLLAERAAKLARHARSTLAGLGYDLAGAAPDDGIAGTPTGGVGGPYLPVPRETFIERFRSAQRAIDTLAALRKSVRAIPLRRPLGEDARTTSPFGSRFDPFTNRPAMHSGIDFRADYGAPVRATGFGTVRRAEIAGGYGKLVEIDHGNGVVTRYAHMSAITVKKGQKISAGQIVGRVGSSGRSTGPHLHYEIRVNGRAVNPRRFLTAGLRLKTLL